jgi:penicillin-binding protein 1A
MSSKGPLWLGVLAESFRLLWQVIRFLFEPALPAVRRSFASIRSGIGRLGAAWRNSPGKAPEASAAVGTERRAPPRADKVFQPAPVDRYLEIDGVVVEDVPSGSPTRPLPARAAARLEGAHPAVAKLFALANRVSFGWRTTVAVSLGAAALVVGLYSNCGLDGCPDVRMLTAYQPGGAPVLLDRNGNRFADLAPYERVVVALDSLPEHVAEAFIAVEDRRFLKHDGVDWQRVVGAAIANVRSGGLSQGSSTISMQLARNVFPEELPGAERTFKRKLEEMRVAKMIEARYEKPAILEMYLNHIYFGGGAYGIEAASRLYFGKPATELTVAEAATLAALPKAPSHYDPRRQPERSVARRNLIVALMAEQGFLSADEAAEAKESELEVDEDGQRDRSGVPLGAYFIDVIRPELEDRFGEALYRSRLHIYTTLDPIAQRAAEEELEKQLAALDKRVRKGEGELQGAAVFLDASTGEVLALVGGRDPTESRYNRAVRGRRQMGSSFKPFVFAAALGEGVPTSKVLLDLPLEMQVSKTDVWMPSNYDGEYEGQVSLRQALVRSRNVPTVRLATEVGIEDVAATARAAGIEEPMDPTPSLALGTVAVSPLQLASAYTTFATLGYRSKPVFVLKVVDEEGTTLYAADHTPPTPGMDPRVAYLLTDILQDAVNFGTGTGVRTAGFDGPAAGKTGTTNDATDAWFVGYTPEIVGSVWVGYDQPSTLGSSATGGGFAAPVWGRVMRRVYEDRPLPEPWPQPEGLVIRRVDGGTGFVLEEGCHSRSGYETTELFLEEHVPSTVCPSAGFWTDLWSRIRGGFRSRPLRAAPLYEGPYYPRPARPPEGRRDGGGDR